MQMNWLLVVAVVMLQHAVANAFHGLESACNKQFAKGGGLENVALPPMHSWCMYQNTYAQRFRTLADEDMYPFTKPECKDCFTCDGDSDNSTCSSIVAMRPLSNDSPQSINDGILIQLVNGELYLYSPTFTPKHYSQVRNKYDDPKESAIQFEVYSRDLMVVVSETDSLFTMYVLTMSGYMQEPVLYPKDRYQQVKKAIPFSHNGNDFMGVYVVQTDGQQLILFYSVGFMGEVKLSSIWRIAGTEDVVLSNFVHHGNFSGNYMSFNPYRTDTVNEYVAAVNLFLLAAKTQVRIFSFQDRNLTIDFSHASVLSTFYVTDGEHNITAVHAFADGIRRPISPSLSCQSVVYQPSQSVYLVVGLVNTQGNSSVVVHMIPEFSFINYKDNAADEQTNPARRPVTFKCKPNQYFAKGCVDVPEQIAQMEIYNREQNTSANVKSFASAFMDIPMSPDRFINNTVNPMMYCNAFKAIAQSGQNEIYMERCLKLIQNLTCEASVFNQEVDDMNINPISAFFYLNWNTQIFALRDDGAVVVLTHSFQIDDQFGNFTLSVANHLKTGKRLTEIYVSRNGQHLFAPVTKSLLEIKSLRRYREICSYLAVKPDDPFLKAFKENCEKYPAEAIARVSLVDFGYVTSSCPDQSFCPFFNQPLYVTDNAHFPYGKYIQRAFAVDNCPFGSFCINGMKVECARGMVCNSVQLTAPNPCSASIGDSPAISCYQSGLQTSDFITDNGLLSSSSALAPVPIPAGKYLLVDRSDYFAPKLVGIRECKLGDYCPSCRVAAVLNITQEITSIKCPANAYCQAEDDVLPIVCTMRNNTIEYCPAGSYTNNLCPAGYYCTDLVTATKCDNRTYCPEGSTMFKICEAGYYCPDPTQQIPCPKGHFCQEGSLFPSRCNFFFSYCPKMSKQDSMTAAGAAIISLILLGIAVVSAIHFIASHFSRKVYTKQRKIKTMKRIQSPNTIRFDVDAEETFDILKVTESSNLILNHVETDLSNSLVQLRRQNFYMDLKFKDLGLELLTNGQRVLHGVTGEINHGQLTCILGQSGAGKSTFLTTLAGRAYYGRTIGSIYVNGKRTGLGTYNRSVGFVTQEDIMPRDCTVEETLYFAARTRLDWKLSRKEVMHIVDNVIEVLNLNHIRHQLIGDEENRGISGGQRKRVNVGVELVSQPVALMCDEPTSGLDAASSKELCDALNNIARSGVNVIAVIHQPRIEIFHSFEQLLLLGQGGKTVYLGPVSEVEVYFEALGYVFPAKVNPADYLLDITSGTAEPQHNATLSYGVDVIPQNLPTIWELHTKATVTAQQPRKTAPVYRSPSLSLIVQAFMCFQRSIIQQLRAIPSILIDLLLVWIGGLLIAISFRGKRYVGPVPGQLSMQCPAHLREMCEVPLEDPLVGMMMMFNLTLSLTGCMAALRTFGKERLTFKKESQTGLSTLAYFFSKDISMLPVTLLAPLVFLAVFYTIMQPRASFIQYYYIALLVYWTSYGLGYLVSIIFAPQLSQLAAVVIVVMLFSQNGVTPRLPDYKKMVAPLSYLPYLSYLFFAQELTYLVEIKQYQTIYDIGISLKSFGYALKDMKYITVYVLLYGIAFRLASFILLASSKPNSVFFYVTNFVKGVLSRGKKKVMQLFERKAERNTVYA